MSSNSLGFYIHRFKAKDGEVFEGHTYLIDESNPQVQRLDIQTKFFPDQAFQFEVIFAPHELHKSALCKTVQFVNNGNILFELVLFWNF